MTISVSGIIFGLLLLLAPLYILYVFSDKLVSKFIAATAKMLVYTGILSAVIYFVFLMDNAHKNIIH